ncbi:MAG: tRNA (N6-isopentenyl adenosine(37)-C2)-methylthiotransferase MiaB [Patescibacteria group bacterium]|nr:tRNA (N6-isopentenyl adenosine(37)-C2)-methylthiotransferase MiaB [Patescibacteria group bacterium]
MKYFIITFGCQMNKTDSERIAGYLEKNNYNSASTINEADLIIVNMCSVRQSAVDRVYGQIKNFKKLKQKNPKLKIILTGCILKQDFEKLKQKYLSKKNQGYDYILPINSLPRWKNILKQKNMFSPKNLIYANFQKINEKCKLNANYLKIAPKYKTKFSAYVPIITGCNNFCSYCVVPYTRRKEISRPANDIINEIKKLIKNNYKHIWLIGENVNSYSYTEKNTNKKINFSKLLYMTNQIKGDFWISFSSSHPKDFSDELIKTIAECDKVAKYISLPVQSGDDKILKKMNRPYTIKQYKNIIKKIREKIPSVVLSTDAIIGFPKETKKQFENTIKLFKEIKPDMAYVARYSPRQGTPAFNMKDSVSLKEKQLRDKKLTETLKKIAIAKNKKYIGKIARVLPEYERKGYIIGKTKEYKTIKFKIANFNPQSVIGKFVNVKITNAIPWGLKGELTNNKL